MNNFLPGDIVEFIDDSLKGKIVSLSGKSEVIIELEEGLEIPAQVSQLVLVERAPENISKIETAKQQGADKQEVQKTNKGIFIGLEYEPSSSRLYFFLINDSPAFILFVLFNKRNKIASGLNKGSCPPWSVQKMYDLWLLETDSLPEYIIQYIRFEASPADITKPVHFSFKISQKKLLTHQQQAPLAGRPMYLVKAPAADTPTIPDREIVKNKNGLIAVKKEKTEIFAPPEVVDLHIQSLRPDHELMSKEEIFNFQFNYFINCFEKAWSLNYPKITFIHGIGAGVLKSRITNYLKQKNNILSFGDGDVKKFGYGATEVRFKKSS